MAEGRYADWMVRKAAEAFAAKRPKREWFETHPDDYYTSLKSWSHICAHMLWDMELEERQLIIFIHHLGMEHIGVETFDPQDKGRYTQDSDFSPNEGQ